MNRSTNRTLSDEIEGLDKAQQLLPIALPLDAEHARVGLACDDVDDVRNDLTNGVDGSESDLDALSRGQEPERRDHRPAVHAEAVLASSASRRSKSSDGAPWGTMRIFPARTTPWSSKIRRAVTVNTITAAARSQSRRSTRFWFGVGSGNTV